MNIPNCIIEITRMCNMTCAHCLRGDMQDMCMKEEHLDSLFSKADYISTLTLTGGEPSLRPDIIRLVLNKAKQYNVEVGSFYIATNGKGITSEFAMVCLEWFLYCEDKEYCMVELSNDTFHDDSDNDNLLQGLSFYSQREPMRRYGVISMGRAQDYGIGMRSLDVSGYEIDEDRIIEGEIYLNCEGYIISSCDLSYDDQEEFTVCHVDDLSIKQLEEYTEAMEA